MIKAFSISCFALFLAFSCSSTADAQSMCPIKTVTVDSVQGKVDAIDGASTFPLQGLKLELVRIGPVDTSLGTAVTDEKGVFKFNDIPKGAYRLSVSYVYKGVEVAPKYDLVLRLKKPNSNSKKYIHVSLSIDCGQNTVEVRKYLSSD